MKHFTAPDFWECYDALPAKVRRVATKNFSLLKTNPTHPSLRFKKVAGMSDRRSVRVGANYRALGRVTDSNITWFWIGSHEEFNKLIK